MNAAGDLDNSIRSLLYSGKLRCSKQVQTRQLE